MFELRLRGGHRGPVVARGVFNLEVYKVCHTATSCSRRNFFALLRLNGRRLYCHPVKILILLELDPSLTKHVRKPTVVECLRGKKIIHVAVGALHCLAVGDTGQVSVVSVLESSTNDFTLMVDIETSAYTQH